MNIRKYKTINKQQVIKLLELNTPTYFDPSEEKELEYYLENQIEDYFVVEIDDQLIGAGGINYELEENRAIISWDVVHPDFQGRGVGSALTKHRLAILAANQKVEEIIVRTAQMTNKFYEKMGFQLIEVVKDYWAKDYDLYLMKLQS